MEEKIENLKQEVVKYRSKYKKYKAKCNELTEENHSLKNEVENLNKHLKSNNKKLLSKPVPDKETQLRQYDIVINVNSLAFCSQKGWKINQRNSKGIEEWSQTEQIAVGVIGRENLGKTWIVNKICNESFASGFYYRTDGLSLKYSHDESKKLKVILDSAGMNSAIYFNNPKERKKYARLMEQPEENEDSEKVKEMMIHDRSMTEYFIQNFILYSCNIILVVVELLSQHDQKIIERVRNVYSSLKTIIVIHNYFKLESKTQVINKANDEITGAFNVIKKNIPNSDVPMYIESSGHKNKKNILHVILGKEGYASGEFFNEASINYIKDHINVQTEIAKFDVLSKLNKYFEEKHQIYFNKPKGKQVPQFELVEGKKNNFFRLNLKEELTLKPASFSVLGSLKDFDINYQVFENNIGEEKEKIYYFELPGCSEKPVLKFGDQTLKINVAHQMEIPPNFKCTQGENYLSNFEKRIKINDEFGEYSCDQTFTKIENGILKMKFFLKPEEKL